LRDAHCRRADARLLLQDETGVGKRWLEPGQSRPHPILFKDIELDYKKVRTTEYEFFKEHAPSLVDEPPGSTVLQAARLARPEFLVEIEAIALLKK